MLISALLTRQVVAELERRGVTTSPLLQQAGISAADLADIRMRIPIERHAILIERGMELTQNHALGLDLVMSAPDHVMQVFWHLMMSARTMRQAHSLFVPYVAFMVEGALCDIREEGELAYFIYDPPVDRATNIARLGAEAILGMTFRMGLRFAPEGKAREVWFKHERPDYAERYRDVFDCPARFDQDTNAIVFPRLLLDKPQAHADETMVSVLRETATRIVEQARANDRAGDRIRALLRHDVDLGAADLESLARRLGMSRRTLRTKLANEGESLHKILDEVRCSAACADLRRPDVCIKSTAQRLGFAERTAFHRAFKRWTGKTPQQFIREARRPRDE
jgi:AraC-like DNA-binding protein